MKRSIIAGLVSVALAAPVLAEESVEVLHWWTSGGEAAALGVLKKDLEGQGVKWNDMPVAGGGGVVINVNGGDPKQMLEEITRLLKQYGVIPRG